MKITYILDSSCGMSKVEIEKRGWKYLPLFVNIDNVEYRDGENLLSQDFYKKINKDSKIKTSASSLGEAQKLFEKASAENDYVIVYPLSMGLSSQANNLIILAKEFKNIFVIPSKAVGYSIIKDVELLEKLSPVLSWEKLKEKALELTNNHFSLSIPRDMKWLIKGGRVTPAMAAMATLLKVVPIISFKDGILEKFGKGRIFKKTVSNISKKILKGHEEKTFIVYYSGPEPDLEINNIVEDVFKKPIEAYPIPSVIAAHIGPGSFMIMRIIS